jgi:hypothetical protein
MQRVLTVLVVLLLPIAALADGMVVPTIAMPAKVTIPDQRALIHFTNGTERLVIETRFNGTGTNFAWVVPFPSQPVVEEATTGLFPTLQYLFRPEIIHDVPGRYPGILALIWLGYVLFFVRPTGRIKRLDVVACLIVVLGINIVAIGNTNVDWWQFATLDAIVFADLMSIMFLVRFWGYPALTAFGVTGLIFVLGIQVVLIGLAAGVKTRSLAMSTSAMSDSAVSILDRKLVGIFETATIASRDPKGLQTWLRENGFALSTNSAPVIESYVKDGWVFVVTKVRRDKPDPDTSTPHPLSFTFKTDKPVYPMRLTGVNNGPLSVELYVFGSDRAEAPHFKVESSTRPNLAHPLLRQWVGDSATVTKLTATLSPDNMREDVWINWTRFSEKKSRLFSSHGAAIHALNWGTGIFAVVLLAIYCFTFATEIGKSKFPLLAGIVTSVSIVFTGLFYFSLPKTEVKLVKGYFHSYFRGEQLVLNTILADGDWHTVAEARAELQNDILSPTNAAVYGFKSWDNYFVGGQIREEDSPGNYILRQTNNQLQLVTFNAEGAEEVQATWDLKSPH